MNVQLSRLRKGRPGFTLMEILVVILIIVTLMALVLGALQWVKQSQAQKQAEIMVERFKAGLSEFKKDNGYFPDGDGGEMSTVTVYEALFGDYNHDGIPDIDPRTKNRNTIYLGELDPNQQPSTPWVKMENGKYVLSDPWGQSFRYRLGWQQQDSKKKEGMGNNPDFDLWSVGADGTTDLKNPKRTGDNQDDIGYM